MKPFSCRKCRSRDITYGPEVKHNWEWGSPTWKRWNTVVYQCQACRHFGHTKHPDAFAAPGLLMPSPDAEAVVRLGWTPVLRERVIALPYTSTTGRRLGPYWVEGIACGGATLQQGLDSARAAREGQIDRVHAPEHGASHRRVIPSNAW